MIESIEIKNFRCFKNTRIAKFSRINLIGGMNNAGKTTLLEAIYLAVRPNASTISFLIRTEEKSFFKERPQNTWNNLFFQQDKEQKISLVSVDGNTLPQKVTLEYDEKTDDLIHFTDIENMDDDEITQILSNLSKKETIRSSLHLNMYKNENLEYSSILVASQSGIVGKGSGSKLKDVYFIPSSPRVSFTALARSYEKARFDAKENLLLKAFQLIDNLIEEASVYTVEAPVLYITRRGEEKMPISRFGDAINRVADVVLGIINKPDSIIIIDEIENGIHFTNHEKLWKMLFDLASEYNVQIFATTHSCEMVSAFVNVIQQHELNKEASYFELAKHAKTGNIIGSPIPIKVLAYDIENRVPFRGE